MTLVVSVRVPDGVVIGADSLATLTVAQHAKATTTATCPKCGEAHDVDLDVPLPPGLGTISTLPYSLKLLPMFGEVAVATFGGTMIEGRTVLSMLLEFQRETEFKSLEQAADDLGKWVFERFEKTTDVSKIPDGSAALGFQVAGYENGEPTTFVIQIGSKPKVEKFAGSGVTVSGESSVVKKLWEIQQSQSQMQSAYNAWSVLDASDYVKFAISTTADFQRFATMVPTVGGEIDIALVKAPGKVGWIQKKAMVDLLLPSTEGGDSNGE